MSSSEPEFKICPRCKKKRYRTPNLNDELWRRVKWCGITCQQAAANQRMKERRSKPC